MIHNFGIKFHPQEVDFERTHPYYQSRNGQPKYICTERERGKRETKHTMPRYKNMTLQNTSTPGVPHTLTKLAICYCTLPFQSAFSRSSLVSNKWPIIFISLGNPCTPCIQVHLSVLMFTFIAQDIDFTYEFPFIQTLLKCSSEKRSHERNKYPSLNSLLLKRTQMDFLCIISTSMGVL